MARPIQIRHSRRRCLSGSLQVRPAVIDAFAGERRRVICVRIRAQQQQTQRERHDGTVPNHRWHRCRRAAWRRGGGLCDRWRPAIAAVEPPGAAGLRCGPRQDGPRSGGDRQLQRLPYRARGQELCRRSAGADAVRHDLLLEHHAGCGDRNRAMVGSRVPARDALRRQPRRPASLSDISLRSLHQCDRRGRPGALCFPDDAAAGACAGAGKPAFLSVQPAVAIAGWKLLFLRRDTYQPDPSQSAEWNRGAYLVEGLAHCGACHTPRNALGAERVSAQFAGGDVDNWHAYALNDQSHAPVPWDADALVSPICATAGTPITARRAGRWRRWSATCRRCRQATCARSRSTWPAYRARRRRIASVRARRRWRKPDRRHQASQSQRGRRVDLCRGLRVMPRERAAAALWWSQSRAQHRDHRAPIRAISPTSCCRASSAVEGERSPIMPGFAASMNDAQVAALLNYLRARFSDQPPWSGVEKTVAGRTPRADRISPDIARAAQRARRSPAARQAMMTLKVNGREHQVDADPDTPLLYVLRDDLKLNAAKFGCGLGQCGACTVIVDGKAVLSCVTPMVLLEGKQVTTLEGLGTIAEPAPIQRAFMEEQAAQCGYCIAGMMMRAQALLQTQFQADRRADPRRTRAASVPLRHPYAHPARGASRDQADGYGGCVAGSQQERPMNAPVILDRRRVLAGGGALIVSFSLSRRLRAATGRAGCGARAEPARQPEDDALSRFLDPDRRRWQHHGLHRQGRTRPGLQDRVSADRRRGARRSLRLAEGRHRRYHAHRERGLYLRQQLDARTAAPRSRTRRRRCANC